MSTLFKMLQTERKNAAKFGAKVRELIHKGGDGGKREVIGCAEAVEAAFPVVKEDGKDANRDERNDYLRSLRMALMRAGRELEKPRKLTIKKVEGAWQIQDEEAAKPEPEQTEQGEGDAPESIGLDDEAAQDALWAAVELVGANIHVPAIRKYLSDLLQKELAKAAKV